MTCNGADMKTTTIKFFSLFFLVKVLLVPLVLLLAPRAGFTAENYPAQSGPQISIEKFFPVRTVIKPDTEIPFSAVLKNTGDAAADLRNTLLLPDKATLLSGPLPNEHLQIPPEKTATLHWTISFHGVGDYDLHLTVFSGSSSIEKTLTVHVTDKYWRQGEFLLSAYNPPYAWHGAPYMDSVFDYYKNAHFDNLLWVRDDDALVRQVHQHGFKYFLDVAGLIGEDELRGSADGAPPVITDDKMQQLDAAIEKFKSDPDLLGYYICDEPFPSAFHNIARVVQRIREKDPERLSFVNIWPYFENEIGDDDYIEDFLQTTKVELLSYDRYNFFNGYDENDAYFAQLERIRRQALKYDIPFCNIVQAVGTNGTSVGTPGQGDEYLDWRTPNRAEHRWLVYSSLVYGVHGIIWFHWDHEWGVTGNPDRDIIYPSLQSINAEIASLKEIMLHLTTTMVYHTDQTHNSALWAASHYITAPGSAPLVVGFFKDESGHEKYFMVMNKNYSDDITEEISMNVPLAALRTFNVVRNQWEEVPVTQKTAGATFTVHLRKGGGKLFTFRQKKMPKTGNSIVPEISPLLFSR